MKIYVGHSRGLDFKEELYKPLSQLDHEWVFPHGDSEQPFESKEVLPSCDVMIAEVSHKSTSLGIEMGWANSHGVTIICIYKPGTKLPRGLKKVSDKFVEYNSPEDLVRSLKPLLTP